MKKQNKTLFQVVERNIELTEQLLRQCENDKILFKTCSQDIEDGCIEASNHMKMRTKLRKRLGMPLPTE